MVNVQYNAAVMEPLGYNGGPQNAPAGALMIAQSLQRGYNVVVSDLQLVPRDPRIRVRVV